MGRKVTGLKVEQEVVQNWTRHRQNPRTGLIRNRVSKKTHLFRMIDQAIDIALRMMETERSRQKLVDMGRGMVHKLAKSHRHYQRVSDNMPYWIGKYVTKLREEFPIVIVDYVEGAMGMLNRARSVKAKCLKEWRPAYAGRMHLNKSVHEKQSSSPLSLPRCPNHAQLIRNTMMAAQCAADGDEAELHEYEKLMFTLVCVIAHEIAHTLLTFLCGTDVSHTPPRVSFDPERFNKTTPRGEVVGEAGHSWTGLVLGGCPELYTSSKSPFGERQAGKLYIDDDNGWSRKIDHRYVQRALHYGQPKSRVHLERKRGCVAWFWQGAGSMSHGWFVDKKFEIPVSDIPHAST